MTDQEVETLRNKLSSDNQECADELADETVRARSESAALRAALQECFTALDRTHSLLTTGYQQGANGLVINANMGRIGADIVSATLASCAKLGIT